ncbi:cache domain-containing protein [Crocosphaera sp.]|uniref:cache domain-containing protein n=1 Tax=Crocosphaera sp. TaxID=2729996 RepID=UPI00262929EF|nr:cache domain-containing protein [Crocosphaera sp.]MDJ0580952.1 cache domain-containing protein [Crocosphaera sp.]
MKQPQKVFRVSLFICISSFLLVIFTGYSYWRERHHILADAKNNAKQEAVEAAKKIDSHLVKLKNSATAIANDLTSGRLKKEQLLDRLRSTMEENTAFYQAGVAYVPYGYDPNIRLYATSYKRKEGKIQLDPVEDLYDYTEPEHDWYHRPLVEGETWVEPYFGKIAQSLLADFCTPFYEIDPTTKKQMPAGVVCVNYSLDNLKQHMTSLELGKTGYGFIFSKKGTFLCHPNSDLVKQQKTIFELPRVERSKQLQLTLEKVTKQSQAMVIDYDDELTGQKAWIFFEPIPSTDWSLGVVFIKDEILVNTESQKQKLTTIILGLIALFFFLSILLLRTYQGTIKSLWLLSYYSSIFLGVGIFAIWSMDISQNKIYQIKSQKDRVLVFGEAGLNKFLNSSTKSIDQEKSPQYIPTGIFIQSLEFQDANDVFVTGYIWQKYNKKIHESISQGFILAEAIDPKITEYYRYREGSEEIIGWYFEAKLRQEFDYSKYPFDSKQVWLRLWHQDFYKNVILTPDFQSYELINPVSRPGLEEDFVLPGWRIQGSFFEYHINGYNTNFGIHNYIGQKNHPELYFTIILQRDFINIFINNLMVPIVVALLLFLVHLLILNEADSLAIVSACSAFLFIVILDQINLRGEILAGGILYLEYFYFILYLLIIAVAINAILFSQKPNIRWLQYQESLIPKLLYWPGMLTLLLVFTLFVF